MLIVDSTDVLLDLNRFKRAIKKGKLMGMLFSPLSIFDCSHLEKEKNFYKGLVKRLREKIDNWTNYKPIRGTIEDLFK